MAWIIFSRMTLIIIIFILFFCVKLPWIPVQFFCFFSYLSFSNHFFLISFHAELLKFFSNYFYLKFFFLSWLSFFKKFFSYDFFYHSEFSFFFDFFSWFILIFLLILIFLNSHIFHYFLSFLIFDICQNIELYNLKWDVIIDRVSIWYYDIYHQKISRWDFLPKMN